MQKAEIAAQKGELGAVDQPNAEGTPFQENPKGRVFDMLIPIFALIVFSILAMLYTADSGGMTPLTILSAQPSATVPLRRLWSWVDLPLWLLRFFCLFPARLSPSVILWEELPRA